MRWPRGTWAEARSPGGTAGGHRPGSGSCHTSPPGVTETPHTAANCRRPWEPALYLQSLACGEPGVQRGAKGGKARWGG